MPMTQHLTQKIAEQALSYRFDRLPADVVRMAQLAILDHLGCALRGMNEPLVDIIAYEFLGRPLTADDLLPNVSAPCATSDSQHAMLHGMAAHAIDFDDTMVAAQAAHIGAGVVSAVLT
ncbi:MAG: 2-methylcitrate dehydratase PrpD, partial [Candidatus Promineifilaceae bacterium]